MEYIDERYKFALRKGFVLNQRYIIQEIIGMGGFGITYKGYDIYNKMDCAIKELFMYDITVRLEDGKTVAANEGREGIFAHGIMRFMEEAEILNEISGTRYIVNITDYFKENNTAYFVMEYIDSPTLKSFVSQRGGALPFEQAKEIISKVGSALDYIYKKYSIFHRDLSPDNIMVCRDGNPKIIDFGNAKTHIRTEGQNHSIVLKPGFAPPEQYTGTNQGPWTDVYSLAVIFYFIASGRRVPNAGDRLAGEAYIPLCEIVSECPKKLSDDIDKALKLNPKERMSTMEEFVSAIRDKPENHGNENNKFPVLTICRDGQAVERWRLPVNAEVIVGRNSSMNHIGVGTNPMLSKQHCVIRYDGNKNAFTVIDISTNGTMIQGVYMKKKKEYELRPGETIWLGKQICELRLEVMQ